MIETMKGKVALVRSGADGSGKGQQVQERDASFRAISIGVFQPF